MSTKEYDEEETDILSKIEEHGWFCMSVFDPEEELPDFSYSIGFTKTLNAPEFIVFGLHYELRHSMLWEAFRQIKAGANAVNKKPWSDLLEGFDCIAMQATHPKLFTEYATYANWFWKDQGKIEHPEVFQLVWPDAVNGLFPWDEGCSQDLIDSQRALWLPNIV